MLAEFSIIIETIIDIAAITEITTEIAPIIIPAIAIARRSDLRPKIPNTNAAIPQGIDRKKQQLKTKDAIPKTIAITAKMFLFLRAGSEGFAA